MEELVTVLLVCSKTEEGDKDSYMPANCQMQHSVNGKRNE